MLQKLEVTSYHIIKDCGLGRTEVVLLSVVNFLLSAFICYCVSVIHEAEAFLHYFILISYPRATELEQKLGPLVLRDRVSAKAV